MKKNNTLFRYSGNKLFLTDIINELINKYCNNYKTYIEPFLGSGAIFYHLNTFNINKKYILNDMDFNIMYMHTAVKNFEYADYLKIVLQSKDIKNNKENYYEFRNKFNDIFFKQSILNKKYDIGRIIFNTFN